MMMKTLYQSVLRLTDGQSQDGPQAPGGGIRRLGSRRTCAGLAVASLQSAKGHTFSGLVLSRLICLSMVIMLPGPAQAASVPAGFSAGLAGPVLTYVHLFGLLGLGLWLDMQGRGSPGAGAGLALISGLVAGLVTRAGIHLPYTGLGLELSLVILGGFLATTFNIPTVIGLVLAAVVGALHGISLSQWGGPVTSNPLFWPGMIAGCLLVLSSGVGLSATLYQLGGGKASRVSGALIAVLGILMLVNVV